MNTDPHIEQVQDIVKEEEIKASPKSKKQKKKSEKRKKRSKVQVEEISQQPEGLTFADKVRQAQNINILKVIDEEPSQENISLDPI